MGACGWPSAIEVTGGAAPLAEVMFIATIPKLPEKLGMHPVGAAVSGVMMAVTAWGAGTGEARTTAAAAKMAMLYFILEAGVRKND